MKIRNKKWKILCGVIVGLVLLTAYPYVSKLIINHQLFEVRYNLHSYGFAVKKYLIRFYDEVNVSGIRDLDYEFACYISKDAPFGYTLDEPMDGYQGKDDIYFHLSLPEKLASEHPTVVAYSGPVRVEKDVFRRLLIVLEGTELRPFTEDNSKAEEMIGRDVLIETQPSFYHWHLAYKFEKEQGE